jgi:hypothetical protein
VYTYVIVSIFLFETPVPCLVHKAPHSPVRNFSDYKRFVESALDGEHELRQNVHNSDCVPLLLWVEYEKMYARKKLPKIVEIIRNLGQPQSDQIRRKSAIFGRFFKLWAISFKFELLFHGRGRALNLTNDGLDYILG